MTAFCLCSPATVEAVPLPTTKCTFPADAHALIYRPTPSVTMSARKQASTWRLEFERRSPLHVEPLMGWTEDNDPLAQVALTFPSAEAAIAYARRLGLRYTVFGSSDEAHLKSTPASGMSNHTSNKARHRHPGAMAPAEFAPSGHAPVGNSFSKDVAA